MRLEVRIEKRLANFLLKSEFTAEQDTFALLGASGCGKTMTLKCIAGIEKPDRGRIVLGDRVLYDSEQRICLPARERKVGYLFQNYALFPNMTVRKNVYCATTDREYADELIRQFCIEDVADQYPAELSGGQSQRTALARMLVTRPEVLLLDEPFAALDNHMRTRMEHVILDILQEYGGPSVIVTHDRNEAYRMAGRIGVMEDGRIVEQKEKKEFFDHPETVAAARLTGCKNISRIEKRNGKWYASDWGFPIAVPKDRDMSGITHLGFRAHYFRYTTSDTEDTIRCRLQRVIEDAFSVVICFTAEGNESDSPDALLTWICNTDTWNEVKEQVLSGSFRLQPDPEKLLYLTR